MENNVANFLLVLFIVKNYALAGMTRKIRNILFPWFKAYVSCY